MEVFYKGEDINIDFVAYIDDAMSIPQDLSGYDIDVALYTNNRENVCIASSSGLIDVLLSRIGNNKFTVVLSKAMTVKMDAGALRVEVKLTNKSDQTSKISAVTTIQLEDSVIGIL